MTRDDLLTALADRLEKTPPPNMDAVVQARLIRFLNQRHRRLLTLPGVRHLREATVPIASVASQPDYALTNIAKVKRLYDPINQRVLYEMSEQTYRLLQPDTSITGTPEAVVWRGKQQVVKQPSDASSLFVKSTSAADTTQVAYVEGIITGGYASGQCSVTLTGTTAVNVSSAFANFVRVDKFYLSAACAGSVTLLEDSGAGTELGRIPIGSTSSDYWAFSLYPTPAAVVNYYADITRAITDFAQATDTPLIPEDFHDLMILGPLADEYQRLSDSRYAVAEMEYGGRDGKGGRVGEMLYWLSSMAIGEPGSLVNDRQTPSQLGSWYAAGT